MIDGDVIRVTTTVGAEPAVAFQLFTEETDLWWRRGVRYRGAPGDGGEIRFEPGEQGRLVEIDAPRSAQSGDQVRAEMFSPVPLNRRSPPVF